MQAIKPVGRNAQALKYDLITVMGAHALGPGRDRQVTILRLITLIVARYNWARDELCVGQREIAQLWQVDPRTVKREFARLRAMGWLRLDRAGARGRVARYGVEISRILADTRGSWAQVGPDLELRLAAPDAGGPAPQSNVVSLATLRSVPAPDVSTGTEWALAAALLHQGDPGTFAAWIGALRRQGRAGRRLTLVAPSRFHAHYVSTHLSAALLAACRSVDDTLDEVVVLPPE